MVNLLVLLSLWSGIAFSAPVHLPEDVPRVRWSPNPLYSEEGFRLGYILRFEDVIFWHFEGRFMMGFGSSPQSMIDRDCLAELTASAQTQRTPRLRERALQRANQLCFVDVNPWLFSVVDQAIYNQFRGIGMVPVVVYYVHSPITPYEIYRTGTVRAIFAYTDNFVTKAWRTNPNLEVPRYYSLRAGELPVGRTVNPAEGFAEGRVVKATMDHYVRKTFEITVQQGRFGNNFARMSVSDRQMFDALVLSMLTGRLVRIGYIRLFDLHNWFSTILWAYSTHYRVTSIEFLDDIDTPAPPVER